jgi:hypothetical protein
MVGLLVLAHSAAAQQAPSEYHMTIKPTDMVLIGKALGRMPYDEVSELIRTLLTQVQAQQIKAPAAPPPAEGDD